MLALFFSFHGRVSRKTYWLAILSYGVAMGVGMLVGFALNDTAIRYFGWVVFAVVVLAVFISSLAITVRRLHDREKSAWWLLVFYIAPNVLSGGGEAAGETLPGALLTLLGAGISIWALVELGFLKGTEGPNKFGEDPLMRPASDPEIFN